MRVNITIDSNLRSATDQIRSTINDLLENQEPILLAIASSLLAEVAYRIHTQGLRGDGSPLGVYKNSYMKIREKNNRTDDKKVVASLTRQMENDFSVVAVNGAVGLGFKNKENFKKAGYIETMYPGTYSRLSEQEENIIIEAANAYINDIFS